jgi:DNA-binding XRE family transcriptional regulator
MGAIDFKVRNRISDCTNYNLSTVAGCLQPVQRSQSETLSTAVPTGPILLGRHKMPVASTHSLPFPNDVGRRFGFRLRDLRRAKNMTQMDMAVAFGIDRSYISDIECGKKGISLATLEVIALGFQIKLSHLLEDL